MDPISILGWVFLIFLILILAGTGMRVVEMTERALIERLGKYRKVCKPWFSLDYTSNLPYEKSKHYRNDGKR